MLWLTNQYKAKQREQIEQQTEWQIDKYGKRYKKINGVCIYEKEIHTTKGVYTESALKQKTKDKGDHENGND